MQTRWELPLQVQGTKGKALQPWAPARTTRRSRSNHHRAELSRHCAGFAQQAVNAIEVLLSNSMGIRHVCCFHFKFVSVYVEDQLYFKIGSAYVDDRLCDCFQIFDVWVSWFPKNGQGPSFPYREGDLHCRPSSGRSMYSSINICLFS